jgi:uncharacterized membrane protein YhdT
LADAVVARRTEDLITQVLAATETLVVRGHPITSLNSRSLSFLGAAKAFISLVAFPWLQQNILGLYGFPDRSEMILVISSIFFMVLLLAWMCVVLEDIHVDEGRVGRQTVTLGTLDGRSRGMLVNVSLVVKFSLTMEMPFGFDGAFVHNLTI